VAREEALSL